MISITHIKKTGFYLCLLFISTLFSLTIMAEENLIKNGGFEKASGHNVLPDGWRVSKPSKLTVVAGGKNGKNAVRVDMLDAPKWSSSILRGSISCKADVKPGKKYCYSGYIKGRNVSRLYFYYRYSKGKKKFIQQRLNLPLNFSWRKFSFIFKVPSDIKDQRKHISLVLWGPRGKQCVAFMDDLNVAKTTKTRNFIINSGFEKTSIRGIPDYWRNSSRRLMNPNMYDAKVVTDTFVGGKKSLCLVLNTPEVSYEAYRRQRLRNMRVRSSVGKTYTVSAYLKTDTPGTKIRMMLNWNTVKTITLTKKWTRYSTSGVWVKKGQESSKSFVNIVLPRSYIGKPLKARIWIDNIQVEEGDSLSPYSPASEDLIGVTQKGKKSRQKKINIPFLQAGKIKHSPKIDGKLDDACWKGLSYAKNFVGYKNNKPVKEQVTVKLAYDDEALYLAFNCLGSSRPKAKAKRKNISGIFGDDIFEFFFDPNSTDAYYYHWAWNARGAEFSEKITYDSRVLDVVGASGKQHDTKWRSNNSIATHIHEQGWSGEIRIPLYPFANEFKKSSNIRANFCRENPANGEISSWAYSNGSFHSPDRFEKLKGIKLDLSRYAFELGRPEFSVDILKKCIIGTFQIRKKPRRFKKFIAEYCGKTAVSVKSRIRSSRLEVEIPARLIKSAGKLKVKGLETGGKPVFEKSFNIKVPSVMTFACESLSFVKKKSVLCLIDLNLPVSALKALKLKLSLKGKQGQKTLQIKPKPGRKTVRLRHNLPSGQYQLTCSLSGKDGKVVSLATRELAIQPFRRCYVRMNPRSMSYEKNGKPFLPVVLGSANKKHFKIVKTHGFNTVWYSPFYFNVTEKDIKEYLLQAKKDKMNLIINFGPMLRYADRMKLDLKAINNPHQRWGFCSSPIGDFCY